MNISALEWWITVGVTCAVLLFGVVVIARKPHEPSTKENGITLAVYIALAVAFGIWVWNYHSNDYGVEFFAGWLTEYSLSVDNLFIFIILVLVFRGILIALGAVVINEFAWVFYIFGITDVLLAGAVDGGLAQVIRLVDRVVEPSGGIATHRVLHISYRQY